MSQSVGKAASKYVQGTGGVVYNNPEYNSGMSREQTADSSILRPNLEIESNAKREEQVWTALANLELDSKLFNSSQSTAWTSIYS